MYNKAINSFKVAKNFGILTCDWCKVLRKYGVNSTQAMRELGVYPKYWHKKLWAHEEYHLQRGEVLPVEYTEAGISDEFEAKVLTRQPRVAYKEPTMEDLFGKADKSFQANGRMDNKPVLKPLNTKAFAGLGGR